MSIYIKNAKIPKCCAECSFETFADDMHYCTVEQLSTEDYWECRPPFCPLTEVPEPHGRLIDADKLLGECRPRGIADDVWKASNEYKQIINAPTVIEGSEPLER